MSGLIAEYAPEWLVAIAPTLTGISVIFGIVTLVATVFGLPAVLGRIPPDYFVAPPQPTRLRTRILRNAIGWPLLLLGIALIPLPGQGLLTVLAGLVLVDMPGKRALTLLLLRQRPIRAAVDLLRARRGVPPLLLEDPPTAS